MSIEHQQQYHEQGKHNKRRHFTATPQKNIFTANLAHYLNHSSFNVVDLKYIF